MNENTTDFRFRWTLSVGVASASDQQDVGHEGVATRCGALSLPSLNAAASRLSRCSRWSRHIPLQSIK